MPTKGTQVVTVRVPEWLAQAIRTEAAELGMTPNAVLTRRLVTAYSPVRDVRKSRTNEAETNEETMELA